MLAHTETHPAVDIGKNVLFGTTTAEWSAPRERGFETDDLGEITDAFVLSASGFPPGNFTDLQFPIVDFDWNLNPNALGTAHGVDSIDDLDEGTAEDVRARLEALASEEFDHDLGE
ncbi:hypothetical protein BRD01_10080 [Halobacteriales archaeon QS_8_65_32]|nr:MAG: hypothetical protein BRD01_10080 [Halobacteriales archaeon QS_8_65_32]